MPRKPGQRQHKAAKIIDVRSLARSHTERAVQTLAALMQRSRSDNVKCSAACALLDRGWGRAQPEGAEQNDNRLIVEIVYRVVEPPAQKVIEHEERL